MTKRKIFSIILTLLLTIVLIACKPNDGDNNDDDKFSELVQVEAFTISSENYLDDKDEINEYYLNRLTEYNINIYLTNESDLEIVTITIDNNKYDSDDFADGSTNKKIVINKNSMNDSGIHNFVIEEIVFLENNKEAKAKLEDVHGFKLYVIARFTPVAYLDNETSNYDSQKIAIDISDRDNLIDFSNDNAKFYLYDNEELIATEVLNRGVNNLEFEELKLDYKYNYQVIVNYDDFSGTLVTDSVLLEGNFKTLKPFEFFIKDSTETEIFFEYSKEYEVDFTKLTLEKDGVLLREINQSVNSISGLEKGMTYNLVFNYNYTYNNETITNKQEEEVKTFEMVHEPVIRNGSVVKHPDGSDVTIPTYKEKDQEIRGIWISTVSNIDLARMQGEDIDEYKGRITFMLDNIKAANLNTVFFQIRPMNDAFYPSELAPWSRYVTGFEGKNPGFDLLGFVIEEAHSRGLELHGWLNPYRVSSSEGMFEGMDAGNFAIKNPELVIKGPGSGGATASILDPGQPRVQQYIRDVIKEIITNYPTINGIHFDDYFYLSTFGENANSADYNTYLEYRLSSSQSIADFRRMSVTKMIVGINDDVEEFNSSNNAHVKFGISPSGIWANIGVPGGSQTAGYAHYSALYADTKLWIENEYIDYIIPQIYWPFTQSVAPYGHLVDWWSNVVKDTDVHLIIGMGLYRYREQTWYTYEFAEQLRYNQNHDEVSGFTMFTYQDLVSTSYPSLNTVRDFIKENYWTKEVETPWDNNLE